MSEDFIAEEVIIKTITHYMGSISGITISYRVTVKNEQEVNEYLFYSSNEVRDFLNNHLWIDF